MKRYLLLLFIFVVGFSLSDVKKEIISLDWEELDQAKIENGDPFFLRFKGAAFTDMHPELPLYTDIFETNSAGKDLQIVIENPKFEEVQVDAEFSWSDLISDELSIDIQRVVSAGEVRSHLKIIPFKKENGKIMALKSFEIKKFHNSNRLVKKQEASWKSESVLKNGNWIKISTDKRGIYKITYSKLEEWGFTNPQNINVFGSGGIPLSEDPGNINYDDLIQNSAWHGSSNGENCLFFYAQGIVNWELNSSSGHFEHKNNIYAQKGYYFLTDGSGPTNQIETLPQNNGAASHQITVFDNYYLHEQDLVHILPHGSGRKWYGEDMRGNSGELINLNLTNVENNSDLNLLVSAIGRSGKSSNLEVTVNQVNVGSMSFSPVSLGSQTSIHADEEVKQFQVNSSGDELEIQFNYSIQGIDNKAMSWIDFIEVNYKSLLSVSDEPLFFRDVESVGEGNVVEFLIDNGGSNTKVLDLSNIAAVKEIPLELSGNTAKFKRPSDTLTEYVVFNSDGEFLEPEFVEEVENQNLHAIASPEFIVISHSNFLDAANALADFHRSYDGMSVEVVTANAVYNEFSSGTKSATGIRNFIKMLYDKGNSLKYVLLMGDGSYDNKNISGGAKNFIPTYQSVNSLNPTSSFVSDDYFVMLDAGESVYDGAIDLGIGRIPASTAYEAGLVVQKILDYHSPETLGDWKNIVCFIGDDEDGSLHMSDSEKLSNYVNANHNEFITDKIYFDSYKEEVTTAGESYPDVNEAINDRVKNGVLVLNYVGHANNRFMADERVLDISDVNTWSNSKNLPIFVTATCEFSRYDAEETSIGEYVLFNPNGGGIGLFSTTRVVYAFSNFLLSRSFYQFVFAHDQNGNRYRMGDIIRLAKVNTINTTNKRNFSLLGDPALKLAYPSYKVVTERINGKDASANPDTIAALERINIEGHLVDNLDNPLNGFTGEINITVYDKETQMETLGNGGETPMRFKVQENIIYKGVASVNNGSFSFDFVVPKDIAYNLAQGKIVYYAKDENQDAHGAFQNFIIGGSSDNQIPDNEGPDIELYLDTPEFTSGNTVGKNTVLFANLSDENGINTVGTGIGHDITAVIDNDYSTVYVLNDYYEANIDDFTSGTLRFPINNLSAGKHTLKLKAWDVANNSSEVEIEFEVSNSFQINTVSNYPNPTSSFTFFTFEHNHSGADLDVIIDIFDQNGRRLDMISTKVGSSGTISNPIRWSLHEANVQAKNGIYIYRIIAKNEEGLIASKSGKMSISY